MKRAPRRSVRTTLTKSFDKLTKKQHLERELKLWGTITLLEMKLKAAQKKIQNRREEADTVIRAYRDKYGPLVVWDVMGTAWTIPTRRSGLITAFESVKPGAAKRK